MSENDTNIVWFIGMSGTGKTTLAKVLLEYLIEKGESAIHMDGDHVRSTIHKKLSFSKADIHKNNIQIAEQVIGLRGKYSFIIISVITPFSDTRSIIRQMFDSNINFIYVKTPIKDLIKRDTKGLYKRSLEGKIDLIGMSNELPFEEPHSADLVIDTHLLTINESLEAVKRILKI